MSQFSLKRASNAVIDCGRHRSFGVRLIPLPSVTKDLQYAPHTSIRNPPQRSNRQLSRSSSWALALITFANVIVRYSTDSSFAWTEEFSVFLMIMPALVAGSAAVARDWHIRIEYFSESGSRSSAR